MLTLRVWPNFLVWSLPWIYASSVKNKTKMRYLFLSAFKTVLRPQNLCWLCPKKGSYFDIYQYFNVAEEIGHLLSIVIYPQFEYTTCISATRSATLSRVYWFVNSSTPARFQDPKNYCCVCKSICINSKTFVA